MAVVTEQTRIVSPGRRVGTVRTEDGQELSVPAGWVLLPPGDAGLTRRVKAAGPTWTVQERKGRKLFSRGVWADGQVVAAMRAGLEAERATPVHQQRREAAVRRRHRVQDDYVKTFRDAVQDFLAFAQPHTDLAARLSLAVTEHATPVGSGTVARAQRIPVEERAEAAVIAWLRHQTTAYDQMSIARIKGRRREIRRMLAHRSQQLLMKYRRGEVVEPQSCPLQRALDRVTPREQ